MRQVRDVPDACDCPCSLPGFPGVDIVPGGQTQEHAQLARSLGVEQLAVVISKLDTCDYSKVRAAIWVPETAGNR